MRDEKNICDEVKDDLPEFDKVKQNTAGLVEIVFMQLEQGTAIPC